jgi:glycosyltransferase involved in cell wall biosynthesis
MKINFYFRHQHSNSYSIENVFSEVQNALPSVCVSRNMFAKRTLDFSLMLSCMDIRADVHHITGGVNYLALTLPPANTVLTVHDVGHYSETLKGIKRMVYGDLFWRYPLRKVRWLTAISEFSKSQLIKYFNVPNHRVQVIPNPVPAHFRFAEPVKNFKPIILQIGAGHNKNVEMLIAASKGLNVKLLLVRKPDQTLIDQLIQAGLDYEFRWSLNAQQMQNAYQQCDLLYFASTYEGFGMPLIEAQKVGRPVLISEIPSLIAIAKNQSAEVSRLNVSDVRNGLLKLIEDSDYRQKLIDKGLTNALDYSAGRIAMQYFDLYKRIAR